MSSLDVFAHSQMSHIGGNLSAKNRSRIQNKRVSHSEQVDLNSEGIARFFNRLYPTNTASEIAARTGIPEGTVKNYLYGYTGWGGNAVIGCVYHFGVDFVIASLPDQPDWLVRWRNMEERFQAERARAELDVICRSLNGELR